MLAETIYEREVLVMRATMTRFIRLLVPGAVVVGAVMLIAATMASGTGVAEAQGNSPAKRVAAGWFCFDVPDLGVHCVPPGSGASSASIPVQIFDTSDPGDSDAPFLGTEILIRADLYHGQPCPQEGLEEYFDLSGEGLPYFACHRYDTSP
jgi:hypothetical protein